MNMNMHMNVLEHSSDNVYIDSSRIEIDRLESLRIEVQAIEDQLKNSD